jgi:uncharacterized RDD family membrane protein YckC
MPLVEKLVSVLPKRIKSAVIDQISVVIAFAIFSTVEELIFTDREIEKNAVYVAVLFFSAFLNKDIYFGKSIGKFFTGLSVVSVRTGESASSIQCCIRNLTLLVWPLEVLVVFFSPNRRIGDILAGTKVSEGTQSVNGIKWHFHQAIISILGSLVLMYYLFTAIERMGIMEMPQ